jgi:hypothetical protein
MARNNLESIRFEHVVYGTSKILNPKATSRDAPIQVEEIERAIESARRLIQNDTDEEASTTKSKKKGKISQSAGGYETGDQTKEEGSYDLAQVLNLYNAAVVDGRFIDDLIRDPMDVAKMLDVEISESAAQELVNAGQTVANHFGPRADFALGSGKKIVAVAVVVVIAIRAETKPYDVVIDSSGIVKV